MNRPSVKPADTARTERVDAKEKNGAPPDPAANGAGDQGERRLVITLASEPAAATRRMAVQLRVTPSEAVRRGLTLLDLYASLGPDEELVIRNKKTGEADRIRIHWGPSRTPTQR